jgi:uncharacterized protein
MRSEEFMHFDNQCMDPSSFANPQGEDDIMFPNIALASVAHRPWPLPSGPWIMTQTWHDLLFAHWPIKRERLRPLVPPQLSLDTFENECWVAVAPFRMSHIHLRGLPALPGLSRFPELNVRTCVTLQDTPGVYFFSLDVTNLPAVWAARKLYRLPYFRARMSVQEQGESISYRSDRDHGEAKFAATYGPTGPVQLRSRGTLEAWLTERYCLYTVVRGRVYRAEIHHQQWPLQDAQSEIARNTMAQAAGIELPEVDPLLHFSRKLEVLVWSLRLVA